MSKQTKLELINGDCCKVNTISFDELQEQITNNSTNCDLSQCSITALQLSNLFCLFT